MEPGASHHLAAMLSADLVDYSRLLGADEATTVARLAALRRQVEQDVSVHGGRLVDFVGDNFLAEFPSALEAVRCAIAILESMVADNAERPTEQQLRVRIGIHLGDVRSEGERLFGTGITVAARLEGIAPVGGLCVSEVVAEQVRGRLELSLHDLGPQKLKNIPGRVRAFTVGGDAPAPRRPRSRTARRIAGATLAAALGGLVWLAQPPASVHPDGSDGSEGSDGSDESSGPAAPLSAVAVLPFEDLSPEADQRYFTDGLAEEIINVLAQSPSLRVVARTSAFAFEGKDLDVREIGARLGAGAVLEGSVRRSERRLRITAQLVKTSDGFHLWSESFDRELGDVFAIQDGIARAVRGALEQEIGLRPTPAATTAATPTTRPEAYESLLRARQHMARRPEGLTGAIEQYERCLELDPDYAPCHAGLSIAVFFHWGYYSDETTAVARIARARRAAERSLALDPELAGAYIARAHIRGYQLDWHGLEQDLERAVELAPSLADGHLLLAVHQARVGRPAQALTWAERAVELDPLSAVVLRHAALFHLFVGDAESAGQRARQALEIKPDDRSAAVVLARASGELGREAESIEAGLRLQPAWLRPLVRPFMRLLGPDRSARLGAHAALALADGRCSSAPEGGAWGSAFLGERDRMYECLGRAADLRRIPLPLSEPIYAPYRDEPRFRAYLERVRLAEWVSR